MTLQSKEEAEKEFDQQNIFGATVAADSRCGGTQESARIFLRKILTSEIFLRHPNPERSSSPALKLQASGEKHTRRSSLPRNRSETHPILYSVIALIALQPDATEQLTD